MTKCPLTLNGGTELTTCFYFTTRIEPLPPSTGCGKVVHYPEYIQVFSGVADGISLASYIIRGGHWRRSDVSFS